MSVLSPSVRKGSDAMRSFANKSMPEPDRGTACIAITLVLVGPHHLSPQHRLIQAELTVELGHRRGRGLEIDNGVDALGMLRDFVRQPASTPDINLLNRSAILADYVEKSLQRRRYGALVQSGIENDHDFVWTH